MRLGLSPLKQQLYSFHIIENPLCDYCYLRRECTNHYLLHCPAFSIPRTHLIISLCEIVPFNILSMMTEDEIVCALLNGHDQLSSHTNKNIFSSVLEYIRGTKRFDHQAHMVETL